MLLLVVVLSFLSFLEKISWTQTATWSLKICKYHQSKDLHSLLPYEMGLPCMFTTFSLCLTHSYFAQGQVIAKIDKYPFEILELPSTILESADKEEIPTLRRYNSGIVLILTLYYIFM